MPGSQLLPSLSGVVKPGSAGAELKQGLGIWDVGMGDDLTSMQNAETVISNDIVSRAGQLHSSAQQSALTFGLITLVVLLVVLAAALAVARSVVRPLRRLRAGALDIASTQLPERVKLLTESPDAAASMEVAPINVISRDEIGEVARAFDQVHSEAVRLAGEQALLRSSFNAMFVNLSRRSQSLIERLARMIDTLEQTEADPDRLGSLFSMDHLVTRMRRNSENQLLLAGHETPRKWSEPVPLADVARAAISEIEQYNRITLNIPMGIAVVGVAVSDVAHLLAELIENATIFSSNDTQILVSMQELSSGGVLIEIVDKGIGVSEARLADMNWRLDNPPTVDVSVSRHMGLFAVARLAERHRVRVRLRPAQPQGLSALVWLPDSVIERTTGGYGSVGWQSLAVGSGPAAPSPAGGRRPARAASPEGSVALAQNGHPGPATGTPSASGNGLGGRRTPGRPGLVPQRRDGAQSADGPRVAQGLFRGGEAGSGKAPQWSAPGHPVLRRPDVRRPAGSDPQGASAPDAGSDGGGGELPRRSGFAPRAGPRPGRGPAGRSIQATDAAAVTRPDPQPPGRIPARNPSRRNRAGTVAPCRRRKRTLSRIYRQDLNWLINDFTARVALRGPLRGGVGRRRAAGAVRGHPRLLRRAPGRHHLRPRQPDGGRGPDLRGRAADPGAVRDGRRPDDHQGDQRRVEPVRARRPQLRHRARLVRDVAAGRGGRRGAVAGPAGRRQY